MRPELSDLPDFSDIPELSDRLSSLRDDAPPPRYGVEDAVTAGRRLRRRHRSGWAIAAVAAVVVAIGAPRVVTHTTDGERQPAPAASVPAAPAFARTFSSFGAGDFTVSEATAVARGSERAEIRRGGKIQGYLDVFRPGAVRAVLGAGMSTTATTPVGGRPASFSSGRYSTELTFRYADDALAVVIGLPDDMTRADLREVAEAFVATPRVTTPRPVTVPVKFAQVPSGYRLVEIETLDPSDPGGMTMLFVPDARAAGWLVMPSIHEPGSNPGITVRFGRFSAISGKPRCASAGVKICTVAVGDRSLSVVGSVSTAQMAAMLGSVTVAPDGAGFSWAEAVPAGALPGNG